MNKEEIIEKLLAGEMKLYQIDNFTENATEALDIRREFIEKHSGIELNQIANYTLDMQRILKILLEPFKYQLVWLDP